MFSIMEIQNTDLTYIDCILHCVKIHTVHANAKYSTVSTMVRVSQSNIYAPGFVRVSFRVRISLD